ncbi:chemotaxis protein CheX [Desulfolithobacter sp.]
MELAKYIQEATSDVFASMIFLDIEPGEVLENEDTVLESNISSIIGLAGDLKGLLAVHCPGEVAKEITGSMLGMEVKELDEDVKDAIGEIANMVAGGLKTALAGEGKDIQLAIPTAIVGSSVRTSGLSGAQRIVVPFGTPSGDFSIELKYIFA